MTADQTTPTADPELLEAIERHRKDLHAHCYRMLGSLHDAEDALQDTLLRAWRGFARFEGRSSVRTWLYTIATNTCLTAIQRRPARALPIDYGPAADPHGPGTEPLAESTWIEPYPDDALGLAAGAAAPEARYERREGVELAFVAALQHLAPRPRAVLILREVLGFSAREVAGALDTTVAAVNSAMQRARKTVEERMPPITQQATLQAVGDDHTRALVRQYTDALESGDVDAVIALLTEDATWSMPPLPEWYGGHASIVTFLERGPMQERWRHIATRASGQPAVACYMWNDEAGAYAAKVIDVLTLRGERIAAVTSFIGGSQFSRFELPPVYPEGAGGTLATSPPTS